MIIGLLVFNLIAHKILPHNSTPWTTPSGPIWTGDAEFTAKLSQNSTPGTPHGTGPIWSRDTELTAKAPVVTRCQHKCWEFESSPVSSVIVKSRSICKCIFSCNSCTKKDCDNLCAEDERLEGARRDVCNYIDNTCYSYKYVREN